MEKQWEMVRDFHRTFGHPHRETPMDLPKDRANARLGWMNEELEEFRDSKNIYEQADAMIDLIYFALGTLVEMGIRPEKLFEIVHEANMAKLFPDGKPHFNSEGKTIKPATWVDPEQKIINEIEWQRDIQFI